MFSPKYFILILVFGTHAAFSSSVLAQESIPEQLQRINESIAVLTAKKQELELRSQIAAKQAEIDRTTNADVLNIDRVRHPVVRSIEGADGKMVATLAFGSGQQQNVKQGDKIPGGWLVSRIGVDAVHISRGNERVRLNYGYEPPPAPSPVTAVPPLSIMGR